MNYAIVDLARLIVARSRVALRQDKAEKNLCLKDFYSHIHNMFKKVIWKRN